MKLTIKDIARMAGVSISSVSRVINNSKPVNDEIRKKVEKVIEETNFRPNALARGLINKSTNLIGVIIPQINPISADLIYGIEEVANQNGYNIILSNSKTEIESELKALDIYKEQQVDGIVLSSVDITERHAQIINTNNIPLVVVGQKTTDYNIPWVDVDNYTSITEIVRYLIRCGHKEIGMIHGPLNDKSAGLTRYQAFLDEIERNRLHVNESFIAESEFSSKGGYKAMEKILRSTSLPSAILCASDTIAIGAKNCVEDRGYFIPDDFSIVGFDDIETATQIRPQLTTVRVSARDMGSKAMEALINLIEQEQAKQVEYYVDYRIIIRDSVKDVRKK